jgi:hypothetical protein
MHELVSPYGSPGDSHVIIVRKAFSKPLCLSNVTAL